MRNLKRVITAVAAAALSVSAMTAAVYAEADISVMAQSLRSEVPEIVSFNDHEPIQIDNSTLVPIRDIADAAAMSVEWNQSRQTATITLDADALSEIPAQQYASKLINKVSGYGLELTPKNISATLTLDSNSAVLRYNFEDADGDIVSIGKIVEMDSSVILVDGGSLMVPIRDTMQLFGFEVVWNQRTMAVKVAIPEYVKVPSGMSIIANSRPEKASVYYEEVSEDEPAASDAAHGTYIGRFKITHYCPCSICNGGYGAYTAWAGAINPGTTIAVNPGIIAPLTWVYVDGYGLRRAEDTGGGIGEYHIDMAVPTHAMAMELGVVYKDVYYAD